MEPSAGIPSAVESPFPGLRAFETAESLLFFGRETHTEELLRRLSESRFLAVVGSSGCGKSSLVRAGLIPALFRGYLVSASSRWRCAILRPGAAPVDALATALAEDGALGAQSVESLREMLSATSGGLVAAVRRAALAPGESLLVVVDQFEEVFRFAPESRPGEVESQVALFVSLLLQAVESGAPIYVTVTMRSEYQGDCAQFPGLTEALNRSQYLVPRLTREQRRQAIVRPLELAGTGATPRLVNRLLNDAGDDPDQLPVLQHALLQTYRRWRNAGGQGDLDLPDYEAIGGIAQALARHSNEILDGLVEDDRRLCERIFRCLTTTERGRIVRRPKELGAIFAVVNSTDPSVQERVKAIVSTFARREHSLLMLSSPSLGVATVVDITHESLMRKWPLLAAWVKAEARSAEWYSDLARDVGRHRTGDSGLWRDPELREVLERRAREGWNEAWALQGSQTDAPPFGEVERFLDDSREAQAQERRREERLRRRVSTSLLLLLVTIVAAIAGIYWIHWQNQRTVRGLAHKFLAAQRSYSEAQQTALQYQARYEAVASQLSAANPAEQARLRQQLQALRNDFTHSQSSADAYQLELTQLRKNQDLATSDHSALLKRIQDLQAQLNTITAERDRLRYNVAKSSTEAALLNQVADLRAQLDVSAAERNKLLNAPRRPPNAALPASTRPIFVVVPQFSVLRLSMLPFNGNVAIGVGDVHEDSVSYLRVYVWTSAESASFPKDFRGDRTRSNRLLAPLDRQACSADTTAGRVCYRVRKIDTVLGNQVAGELVIGGFHWEIRATAWNNHVSGQQDSVALALYSVPAGN